MSAVKITGTGVIAKTDTRFVRWVGRTKGGKAAKITIQRAYCLSNPDWTFAEKDDTVPEVEFTGLYDDEKLAAGDRTEPWELETEDGLRAGNQEIVLGVGKFYLAESGPDFSSSSTYAVGDVVLYQGTPYKCKTAIATAGEWDSSKWDGIEPTCVGLTRGGGKFVVEREFRAIKADDDPGMVEGRVALDAAQPRLKFNSLQWITKVTTLYAATKTVD